MKTLSETVRVKVRFSEVDPLKVVWHGNYVQYLEDAREAFGRRYGIGYRTICGSGYYAPVYDMHLRFERAATVDDELLVTITWRPEAGAKLVFDYEIRGATDNCLILRAETIQLFTTVDGVFDPSEPEFFTRWKEKCLKQEI